MQVLVLGGNGFIGSHLVDQLLNQGDRVRVFDRAPDKYRDALPGVNYFYGEFNDSAMLAEALQGVEVVYHVISTTVPSTSNLDPVGDINGNLINTVKLLELMRLQNVKRIVYFSSGGTVYGRPEFTPVTEDHPKNPISSYGVIKLAIEQYLSMYYLLHGISYVALRASNPYGSRQGHSGLQGVIGTYIDNLNKGFSIEVWGTGEVVRDFIHISDLVELSLLAGRSDKVGLFNAGYGQGASILDIITVLAQCAETEIKPVFKPGRDFDVPNSVLDISKAQEQFGWSPKVSLQEGIADTLKWSRA